MGTMTFHLPPGLPPEAAGELERCCMAGGPDNMPYPTQVERLSDQVILGSNVDESGYVTAPWQVGESGLLMVSTATLMERQAPYRLLIELARGKVNQVRNQTAEWQFGGLDVIVCTAAIYPVPADDAELSDVQWAKTFSVNVTGNYLLVRAAASVFQDQQLPSAIVLASSANAVVPKKGSFAYDTSKTAVNHLIRELAIELSPLVRVNGIAPGVVDTPMWATVDALFAKYEGLAIGEKKKAVGEAVPLGRMGDPTDMCGAAVFLASEEAGYITAQTLNVDGGNWMS